MNRGGLRDGTTPDVRVDHDALCLRECCDVLRCREAATGGKIGLGDIDSALRQELLKAIRCVFVFASGNWRAELATQFAVAVHVLGYYRLFVPTNRQGVQAAAELQGIAEAVGVVAVDHELCLIVAKGLTYGLHELDIVSDTEAEFDLHGSEACFAMLQGFIDKARTLSLTLKAVEAGGIGLNGLSVRASQQLMNGALVVVASDIPEGNIDRADGGDQCALASVVARVVIHAVPERTAQQRVFALDQWLQCVADGSGGDLGRLEPLAKRFPPALESGVCTNSDQRRRTLPDPALRKREGFVKRCLEDEDVDFGDDHAPILVSHALETWQTDSMRENDNGNPTAAMLIIGNEILSGRTQDCNLSHVASRLSDRGIQVAEARVVADVAPMIVAAINELRQQFDLVFTSGGIGPTHDDITADCVAEAFGVGIGVNEDAQRRLALFCDERGIELNESRLRMARIPVGASLIDNPVSAAPGFIIGNVYVMAGVPRILRAMLESVWPALPHGQCVNSLAVTALDLGEGDIAAPLRALQERWPQVDIGSYPGRVDGRSRVELVARSNNDAALQQVHAELQEMVKVLAAAHGGELVE